MYNINKYYENRISYIAKRNSLGLIFTHFKYLKFFKLKNMLGDIISML